MALRALLLASALLLAAASGAPESFDYEDDAPPAGAVAVLTAASFDAAIKEHKHVLAEFYAPWCGHCKQLAPEYEAAATQLKEVAPGVLLAKTDCTVETALCERFSVRGYPTLQWFTDGEPSEYGGGRTAPEIVKWIKKKTTSAVTLLATAEEADAFKAAGDRLSLVAFLKAEKGKEATAVAEAAAKFDDSFGITTSAAVAKHLGITGSAPAVVMLRTFDEPLVKMEGKDFSSAKILEFAEKYSRPLLLPFNDANSKVIFESKHHVLTLLPAEGDHTALLDTVRATSTAMRGKAVQFVSVDAAEPSSNGVLTFFGAAQLAAPKVVGFVMGDAPRKFQYTGDQITEKGLAAFAAQVLDLTAPPLTLSAPVPENNDGPLVEVVGSTVDSIVLDPTKDVLLEVYSPNCGHCKALEPVYSKLARRFADVSSVVIAKIDGTANEHPKITAAGFPTLLFWAAREGAEPKVFEGERTLKALTKFIKEHAATSYELPKKDKGEEAPAEEPSAPGETHDEL